MAEEQQATVSVSIEDELLAQVDQRVAKLDLNRSQYFRRLAREDLLRAKQEKARLKQAA